METSKGAMIGLVLACFFWGLNSTVSKLITFDIPVLYYASVRFLLGGLLLAFLFRKHLKQIRMDMVRKAVLSAGFLFGGFILETYALSYTTPLKIGFVVSFETIFIPIIFCLVSRAKLKKLEVLSILMAFIGLLIFNFNGISFDLNIGDYMAFSASLLYASYVVYISRISEGMDEKNFCVVQTILVSVFAGVSCLFSAENISGIHYDFRLIVPILISGLLCSGLAFYWQISAQKKVNPVQVGIILSIAPIFNAITARIVFNEQITALAVVGGVLIVLALNMNPLSELVKRMRKVD